MKQEDSNCSYSLLIDCPDCYLDILSIFLFFLDKNWKDRICTVYVSTQTKDILCPKNVKFIKCGENKNSIERSVIAMNKINTKYVALLNSDDFFIRPISNERIQELIDFMLFKNIEYLQVWKLKNKEHRLYKTEFDGVYYCNKKARYSKSLMANIWERKSYINLFSSVNLDGWKIEGLWLKECLESEPGYDENYCYCDNDPFSILHAVSKGCWIRKAYRKLRRQGFSKKDLSSRKKLSVALTIKQNISMFLLNNFSSKTFLKLKTFSKKQTYNTTNY